MALALAAMLLASPLRADGGPPSTHAPLDLRYTMTYAGMHVADLALDMQATGDGTKSELTVRAEGLAGWLSDSFSRMRATSTMGPPARPGRFSAAYSKRDRDRETVLRWDGAGRMVEATEARNGRKKPSEVPESARAGAVDPLTAILRLRDWLAGGAREGAELRMPVTDGRKSVELVALRQPDEVSRQGTSHQLSVRLLPVFGFEPGDGLVSWPGDPRAYEIVVSGDGRYAPIEVRENAAPLITLSRDCAREPGCKPLQKR